MSSIGSGPGITGHIETSGIRAISGADPRPVPANTTPAPSSSAPTHSNEAAAMVSSTALNAGQVPVDGERVAQIRKAIQTGSYPVLPVKISDAMIAAGIMLQVRK